VTDGSRELDVTHPAPPNPGPGNFYATSIADNPLILDLLVLAAVALPVLSGPEDTLTEQPFALRLEGAVVDGLRLLHLTVGPLTNGIGRGQADTNSVNFTEKRQGRFLLKVAARGSSLCLAA